SPSRDPPGTTTATSPGPRRAWSSEGRGWRSDDPGAPGPPRLPDGSGLRRPGGIRPRRRAGRGRGPPGPLRALPGADPRAVGGPRPRRAPGEEAAAPDLAHRGGPGRRPGAAGLGADDAA